MALQLSKSSAQSSSSAAAAADDSQTADFFSLDELQKLGINQADIQKLKLGGIHTVGMLLRTPSKDVLALKGISDVKYEKLKEAAIKLIPTGFISGVEALAALKSRMRITTGSKELDSILGGGVETGTITEIFGEGRTGKTQICSMLAVCAQLQREHGGAEGKVIIINSVEGVRVDRVCQIAESRFGLSGAAVLENIRICQAYTHEMQAEALMKAAAIIAEDEEPYRLLIVDSVMALFRSEFHGRGELADRQQKIGVHMAALKKLAEEFNLAVVVTNQMTADPGSIFVPDAKKPIGGNVLAHASQMRVYLRKGKGEQRIAKIFTGPVPELEATFSITNGGISDAEG